MSVQYTIDIVFYAELVFADKYAGINYLRRRNLQGQKNAKPWKRWKLHTTVLEACFSFGDLMVPETHRILGDP